MVIFQFVHVYETGRGWGPRLALRMEAKDGACSWSQGFMYPYATVLDGADIFIYPQNWVIYGVNVGKYSSTMGHMGYSNV